MTFYFTGDTHFGHRRIMEFCPTTRGHYANVDDMDNSMILNWNMTVGKDDVIYHVGDFAFANHGRMREIFLQLNGRIRLITGNHDTNLKKALGDRLLAKGLLECRYPGYHEANFNGTKVVINHFAQRVWNNHHHGALHVYGHSHGSLPGLGKSVDVGVDSAELGLFTGENMRPYSLEEVVKYLDSKEKYMPDHHS